MTQEFPIIYIENWPPTVKHIAANKIRYNPKTKILKVEELVYKNGRDGEIVPAGVFIEYEPGDVELWFSDVSPVLKPGAMLLATFKHEGIWIQYYMRLGD